MNIARFFYLNMLRDHVLVKQIFVKYVFVIGCKRETILICDFATFEELSYFV